MRKPNSIDLFKNHIISVENTINSIDREMSFIRIACLDLGHKNGFEDCHRKYVNEIKKIIKKKPEVIRKELVRFIKREKLK